MPDPGRACHIDFAQVATDHIQTNEPETVGAQSRTDDLNDSSVSIVEVEEINGSSDPDVGPKVATARDAKDCSKHVTVEEDDASISFVDFGQEPLGHYLATTAPGKRIDDRETVRIAGHQGLKLEIGEVVGP